LYVIESHVLESLLQDALNVFLGNHPVLDNCGELSSAWNSRHGDKRSLFHASLALVLVSSSYLLVRRGDGGKLQARILSWTVVMKTVNCFRSRPHYANFRTQFLSSAMQLTFGWSKKHSSRRAVLKYIM
jgi:hypothetical protein